MRAAGRYIAMLAAALVSSLVFGRLHPFGDPQLFAASRTQPPQIPASIPAAARAVLAMDCADCHSMPARAPLYGHLAPVSWLLERDILEARSHLNLSAWDGYPPERKQVLLAEIEQQAKGGHMPPPQYLLVHRDARPDAGDVAALVAWVHAASLAEDAATVSPSPTASAANFSETARSDSGTKHSAAPVLQALAKTTSDTEMAAPDAARGEDLFNRRCTGCHTLTQNREGPHLAGVYGRVSASVAGFPYSGALSAAHLTWNEQTLDRWLTDPDAFIPGVNMDFRVPKAQERADIIAYLKTLSN
jgi:cytochrome c